MKFYIADTHFYHDNVIKFDDRPFENIEDMHNQMIERWNSVVSKADDVYVVGDFIWKNKEEHVKEITRKLNGKIHLILGNHDKFTKHLYRYFASVSDIKTIQDGNDQVVLCHFPLLFYPNNYNKSKYMICGHVHTTLEDMELTIFRRKIRKQKHDGGLSYGNIINVGCMKRYMDYTPRTLEELKIYLNGVNDNCAK